MTLKNTFLFLALLFFQINLMAQPVCGCATCVLPIANGETARLFINVENAANNDLSAANQGLCRVRLEFSHFVATELQLELRSPSGQSVVLLPAKGDSVSSGATRWAVDFVPCGQTAVPDTGYVANFGNNDWGQFQFLMGSYYPAVGCLEDFNAGPVNGTWQIVAIESGASVWAGVITGVELEFCQMAGVQCSEGEPPIVPASNCANAQFVPNLNGFLGSNYNAVPSDSTQGFCGTTENEQWLAFVAPTDSFQITVIAGNCAVGDGLQAAVYPACDAPPIACDAGQFQGIAMPNILEMNELVVGETYFLLVDGFAGDRCDFFIQTNPSEGASFGNPTVPRGNSSVCIPSSQSYEIPAAYNPNGYKWTIQGDGFFTSNNQKTLFQINPDPSPVEVLWQQGGGSVCVQTFSGQDTSAAKCRGVISDTLIRVNLPFLRLCEGDLPYQPPFAHPPISATGVYYYSASASMGCDTLFSQEVQVSAYPEEVVYPPVVLINGQCFTLPNGDEVCDAGNYEIQLSQSDDCPTTHRFSINTIEFTPVNLACAPLVVPFAVAGPDTANLVWTFVGGNPSMATGGSVEGIFENAGQFGFEVEIQGQSYSFVNQFGVTTVPQAEIALQQQGATVGLANSGIGNPLTLDWDFGDGTTASGQNVSHTYLMDSTYTIVLTVGNACGTNTDSVTVVINTVSTSENTSENAVFIYPNPNTGSFFLEKGTENGILYAIDALGKTVFQVEITASNTQQLIQTGLPKGVYFFFFENAGGIIGLGKVVIQR